MKPPFVVKVLFIGQVCWLGGTFAAQGQAGSLGIGTNTPHPSSMLDVVSANKGVLLPRVHLAILEEAQMEPGDYGFGGTLLYNTNATSQPFGRGAGVYYYKFNYGWVRIPTNDSWSITGNANTNPSIHTLGTGSFGRLKFVRNNNYGGMLTSYTTLFGNGSSQYNGFNTAFGAYALSTIKTGSNSTAVGFEAMFSTGNSNSSGVGENNNAVGRGALYDNISGEDNVAFGAFALNNSLGSGNVAIGYNSLVQNVSGNRNVAIGYNAGTSGNISNAIAIGADAVVGTSNSLVFGGTGAAAVMVGIGVTAPTADLDIRQKEADTAGISLITSGIQYKWRTAVDASGNLDFYFLGAVKSFINGTTGAFVDVSDRRVKKDIRDLGLVLNKIMQLRPKTYRFIEGGSSGRLTYGFLAQDVEKLFPEMVSTQGDTGMKAIAYQDFGVLAIQSIREQQVLLAGQEQTIKMLREKIEQLELAKK